MNSSFTFALPSGYDYDVKKFARSVTTKKWAKQFASKLDKYADKFTNAGADSAWIVGGMLQAAYGVNIGLQVEAMLKPEDIEKIELNIIQAVYNY